MTNRSVWKSTAFACLAVLVLGNAVPASQVADAVKAMADRLERSQVQEGPDTGLWASEELFMGSMTGGVACAYEWLGGAAYATAAKWGGYYILRTSDVQGNLLGDEAYAFVRLSQLFDIPPTDGVWRSNVWREALVEFYASTRRPGYEESTQAYLAYFDVMEPSTTVFFLAHHVVGAYYADDQDKAVWRDALIKHLSRVDDNSSFPVMALGVATWALATIDGLDDTPVAADDSSPHWDGIVLSDLPALLLSHQVPEGEPFAGSFYWRFDHTSGALEGTGAGYTEDAIYGAIGLVAAASLEHPGAGEDLEGAITAAYEALLPGVDAEGKVYEHLSLQGATHHAFAGEMLQALWSTKQYLDAAEGSDSEVTE